MVDAKKTMALKLKIFCQMIWLLNVWILHTSFDCLCQKCVFVLPLSKFRANCLHSVPRVTPWKLYLSVSVSLTDCCSSLRLDHVQKCDRAVLCYNDLPEQRCNDTLSAIDSHYSYYLLKKRKKKQRQQQQKQILHSLQLDWWWLAERNVSVFGVLQCSF